MKRANPKLVLRSEPAEADLTLPRDFSGAADPDRDNVVFCSSECGSGFVVEYLSGFGHIQVSDRPLTVIRSERSGLVADTVKGDDRA